MLSDRPIYVKHTRNVVVAQPLEYSNENSRKSHPKNKVDLEQRSVWYTIVGIVTAGIPFITFFGILLFIEVLFYVINWDRVESTFGSKFVGRQNN